MCRRGVACQEKQCSEEASDVIPIVRKTTYMHLSGSLLVTVLSNCYICNIQIRSQAMKDRAVLEKGLKAFVSFVRGYKEHLCSYIFRFIDAQ